jgi:hypothetical protein
MIPWSLVAGTNTSEEYSAPISGQDWEWRQQNIQDVGTHLQDYAVS